MIVTSLLRGRLNRILWRAVHLLAYASWPVAFAHSIGSSKDLQQGWMLGLAVGCALIVAAAVIWRLAHAARQVPRAGRVAAVFAQHTASAARHGPPDRQACAMTTAVNSRIGSQAGQPGRLPGCPACCRPRRRTCAPTWPGTAPRRTGSGPACSSATSRRPA